MVMALPSRNLYSVAGGGHIALSALLLVCCNQAAARRMVVELSLIFADLPNQTMDEQKGEMSLKASGFIRSDKNVSFGSEADVSQRSIDVRFAPESRHWLSALECPLCAKSGRINGVCASWSGRSAGRQGSI